MYKTEILPHTADLRIRIEADSLEEVFEGSMTSMANLLKKAVCSEMTGFTEERTIDLKAGDKTALLIDFLSEVLTESYASYAVFCQLSISRLDNGEIKAHIRGKKMNGFDEDIKAVTYHEAEVRQDRHGKWSTNIIFDI